MPAVEIIPGLTLDETMYELAADGVAVADFNARRAAVNPHRR